MRKLPPYLVRSLSKESLGVYLMHNYFLFIAGFLIAKLQAFQFLQIPLKVIFNPISQCIFAVTLSIIASKVLKKYRIGRWMLLSSQQPK